MYDSHIHTRNSYDSVSTPAELVQAAMAAGGRGMCPTDHADLVPTG